jgi:hypothetical protein
MVGGVGTVIVGNDVGGMVGGGDVVVTEDGGIVGGGDVVVTEEGGVVGGGGMVKVGRVNPGMLGKFGKSGGTWALAVDINRPPLATAPATSTSTRRFQTCIVPSRSTPVRAP